jgi:hypothetical protein
MQYARLYTDHDGESHFEDVAVDLVSTEYIPPAAFLRLSASAPAIQFGFMNAPTGWSMTGMRPQLARSFLS